GSAESVGDRPESPVFPRRAGALRRAAGGALRVDAERRDEEPVGHVLAGELELHRLAHLERDLLRNELEPPRGDGHDPRSVFRPGRARTRTAVEHRGDGHPTQDDANDTLDLHVGSSFSQNVGGFSSWAKPSVPENSFIASSTSRTSTASAVAVLPPVSSTTRSPRFRKGCAGSNAIGFFSSTCSGSGNAKLRERAAKCRACPIAWWSSRWMWP